MTVLKMTRDAFLEGIAKLINDYTIVAPSRSNEKLDYTFIDDPTQIDLSDALPYKSPKEILFPRVETLMRFSDEGIELPDAPNPTLLIGVKPCDITSLNILDKVFSEENNRFSDPYYFRRRNLLLTVGMGCHGKKPGCFCDELGIDMSFSDSCDAFMNIDSADDSIILHIFNKELEELFSQFDAELIPEDKLEDKLYPKIEKYARLNIKQKLKIDASESDVFETMPWDIYSEACLECGTCTYICPTCHCFEFRDVEDRGVTSRNRCWDSCMYPKFTLHASGHNPRSSQRERFRQRVLHKYMYIPKNCSVIACTGCGRCIRACPGGVNIHKSVKDIIERVATTKSESGSKRGAKHGI